MPATVLSLTLYENAHEVIELAGQLAAATTPEEQAELAPALCQAIAGTKAKVDRCTGALIMLAASQRTAREEAARLSRRAQQMEAAEETLRRYVLYVMDTSGLTRLEGNTSGLRRQQNPAAVSVPTPASVPAEYWVQQPPPPPTIDRFRIGQALKAGTEVPGCELTHGYHLRFC